jgi:hypothetical protein
LEQISTVDEQVRRLARRLDEADAQRLGALGKLLRDYIGEWRESEQRTGSALHNLEEAISRLGESVDTMEASRPAPDLALSTFAAPELERAHVASNPFSRTQDEGDRALATRSYSARLEAADYIPRPVPDLPKPASEPPPAAAEQGLHALSAPAIEWSARPAAADQGVLVADTTPGELRVAAMRAKLRRTRALGAAAASEPQEHALAAEDDLLTPAGKRTRFGLLLIAGATLIAGCAYLLLQAFASAAPPVSPVRVKPSAPALSARPDVADILRLTILRS